MQEPSDPRVLEQITICPPDQIFVSPRVTAKCFFGCSCYAHNGGCPPYSLKPLEFIAVVGGYDSGILFVWRGASGPDQRDFQKFLLEQERFHFLERGKLFALSFHSGPCRACGIEDPTRCPVAIKKSFSACKALKKRRNSLEACGVDVWRTLAICKAKTKLRIWKRKEDVDKAVSVGILLLE